MSCVGLWRGLIARSIRRALLRDAQHPAGIRPRLILGKTLRSRGLRQIRPLVCQTNTVGSEKSNSQLVPGEELGMLRRNWLGVRDGIRNWLVTAA